MKHPPFPENIGKQREIKNIRGEKVRFIVEDEIVRPQAITKNPKLIYLQRLRFEGARRTEYRFAYYMLGRKGHMKGKWVFAQFALLIPVWSKNSCGMTCRSINLFPL